MYVGIDIGGTKTLVASLTNEGVISDSIKFPTPTDYEQFKHELANTVAKLSTQDFRAGAVAAPGELDRKNGIVKLLGNLGWKNVHLLRDVEKITGCPMFLENDAKLGGLGEAVLVRHQYKRVLYVTISTGIGYGLVVDGAIDDNISDAGGRNILLEHHGKLVPWETFASGSAIVKRYGKRASDLNDPVAWKAISRDLAPGFLELIAILQPEVIVTGGGVGHYLEKYHDFLISELKKRETPMLEIPPIIKSERPEEAVIYGCYELAKTYHA